MGQLIKVKIKRQNLGSTESYFQSFSYEGDLDVPVTYVLDQLNNEENLVDIEGKAATPITWECSCQQKICGACAMVINGLPRLACSVKVKDVLNHQNELELKPLSKFPVVCDLKVDRSILHENMKAMQLWLTEEAKVNPKYLNEEYTMSRCLMCGCCLEVCPNYTDGKNFAGAVAANVAFKMLAQSTEEEHIKAIKDNYKKKVFDGCSKSMMCEKICPMEIPTVNALNKMNQISVWKLWNLFGKK